MLVLLWQRFCSRMVVSEVHSGAKEPGLHWDFDNYAGAAAGQIVPRLVAGDE